MNAARTGPIVDRRPASGAGPRHASALADAAHCRSLAVHLAQGGAAYGRAACLLSGWLAPAALALCALLHAGGAVAQNPSQNPSQPVQGRYAMALPLHPASAAPQAQGGAQAITPLRARTLFRLYCSGCHQADGSGSPAFGIPSMRGTLGYFQRTPAGRAFLVQAPGARNAHITDAELAALTNWALHEFSTPTLPADFKPYTTEEVARWRANPPLDVAGARAAIAAGFPK